MENTKLSVIILSAGMGTRMKSKLSKPLHKIGNLEMVNHVIQTSQHLQAQETVVVVSVDNKEQIEQNIDKSRKTTNELYPKGIQEKTLQTIIEHLKENFKMELLTLERLQVSSDGTRKYLFKLSDGHFIESVLMRHNYGNSICVTSEVGCNMGCAFCASGELGCVRRLTLEEMVLQVLTVQKDLDKENSRITNVVVMGIGEPFDNYEVLLKFLTVINYAKGLEIGARHITVSTCGLIGGIKKLAEEGLPLTLALSLHAPNDTIRKQLMPVANSYSIEEVLEACDYYYEKTSRRITYEYSLVKGVNDSVECAKELCTRLKGKNCHVNLIPVNPIKERDFEKSRNESIQNFKNILEK